MLLADRSESLWVIADLPVKIIHVMAEFRSRDSCHEDG